MVSHNAAVEDEDEEDKDAVTKETTVPEGPKEMVGEA
jgi:hypothetical protein